MDKVLHGLDVLLYCTLTPTDCSNTIMLWVKHYGLPYILYTGCDWGIWIQWASIALRLIPSQLRH